MRDYRYCYCFADNPHLGCFHHNVSATSSGVRLIAFSEYRMKAGEYSGQNVVMETTMMRIVHKTITMMFSIEFLSKLVKPSFM